MIGNSGKIRDKGRDSPPGIDERFPFPLDPVLIETHCADLNDGIIARAESGGFNVQGYDGFHGSELFHPKFVEY